MNIATADPSDTALVERSLRGERDAFEQIVTRYQSLVCSLAYGIVGNLARSEDVAQEAFVAAWKQLGTLQDHAKFRAWLCGITRHLALGVVRHERRTESLDDAGDHPSPQPTPGESAVTSEEQTLVWNALESLPENYREPLILFYREEQSVARVAESLELSEDAVKQRLSRGRELVRAQMAALVEGALTRSRPGKVFTLAVMVALPGIVASSVAAATLGAAGKVTAPMAKAVASAGVFSAALGILFGLCGAALGVWFGVQTAVYERQRAFAKRAIVWLAVLTLVWMAPFLLIVKVGWRPFAGTPRTQAVALIVWAVLGIGLILRGVWWEESGARKICVEESAAGVAQLPLTPARRWLTNFLMRWEPRQWRSRWSFLGLPLVDVNFGGVERLDVATWVAGGSCRATARGWIAIGDRAQGILFAFGDTAVGGIAIGGVSAGVISVGGLAVGGCALGGFAGGVFPFGGFALGLGALGGMAVGWWALGGAAVAWEAAKGGAAFAHDFAVGGQVLAAHANDAAARDFIAGHAFFQHSEAALARVMPLMQGPWFALSIVCITALLPVLLWFASYRRRKTPGNTAS